MLTVDTSVTSCFLTSTLSALCLCGKRMQEVICFGQSTRSAFLACVPCLCLVLVLVCFLIRPMPEIYQVEATNINHHIFITNFVTFFIIFRINFPSWSPLSNIFSVQRSTKHAHVFSSRSAPFPIVCFLCVNFHLILSACFLLSQLNLWFPGKRTKNKI